MINVLLNETGEYARIDSIMPLFPGLPTPTTQTQMKTWDMDAWDDKAFEELPEWVQEKIKKSTQYQKEHAPATTVSVTSPAAAAPAMNPFASLIAQAQANTAATTPQTVQEECPI